MLEWEIAIRPHHHAIEVWIAPELFDPGQTMISAGIDAKYLWPVADHVELYLRGSASHLWIDGAELGANELVGYGGRGLGVGTGIQIAGDVPLIGLLAWPLFFVHRGPKIRAALWLEQGYDFYRLRRDPHERVIDAQITRWTVGVAFGQAF